MIKLLAKRRTTQPPRRVWVAHCRGVPNRHEANTNLSVRMTTNIRHSRHRKISLVHRSYITIGMHKASNDTKTEAAVDTSFRWLSCDLVTNIIINSGMKKSVDNSNMSDHRLGHRLYQCLHWTGPQRCWVTAGLKCSISFITRATPSTQGGARGGNGKNLADLG